MEMKDQIVTQVKEAINLGKALDAKLVEINKSLEKIKSLKSEKPGITFEEAREEIMEYVEVNQMAALYVQDINHISSILCTLYPLVKIGEIDLGLNEEDNMLFEGIGETSKYIFALDSTGVVSTNEEVISQFKEQVKKSLNDEALKQMFNKL